MIVNLVYDCGGGHLGRFQCMLENLARALHLLGKIGQ